MLFSFSIIYHAYALLVPKVNTYFCIFCKNSPILIPEVKRLNPSGRFLNPGVKMGKLHFAHILHCTTIHSGTIHFLTNSFFFVWMLNIFLGYFFCFQYAYFFDYFLLFKNFFHHLCIWKRNMRVRGKKLFNKNICFILREK